MELKSTPLSLNPPLLARDPVKFSSFWEIALGCLDNSFTLLSGFSCAADIGSLYSSHLGGISVPKLDVHFMVLSWKIVKETFSAKHHLLVEWKRRNYWITADPEKTASCLNESEYSQVSWTPQVFCREQMKQENGRSLVEKSTWSELQTFTNGGIAGDWHNVRHGQMLLGSPSLGTVALSRGLCGWGNQSSLGHLCVIKCRAVKSGCKLKGKLLVSQNNLDH